MATATAAVKKTAIFPDEIFLNAAIKEGRAVKKELSLKALGKPDTRLQQRVKTDVNHVRLLEGILREGERLRPIVVFEDETGKFHLADGFHRHGAHVSFGASSIWAWVIPGTWRDAMVYSTMCNRNLCLKRTPEDVKKAVMTILDDEEWRGKSDAMIGQHCGTSPGTVSRYRTEHSVDRGVPIPATVTRSDGLSTRYRRTGKPHLKFDGKAFRATVGTERLYLGRDNERAKAKLDSHITERDRRNRRLEAGYLRGFFSRQAICLDSHDFGVGSHRSGLGSVLKVAGIVLVPFEFSRLSNGRTSSAVPTAVGRVLLARQLIDPSARAVVVCYVEDAPPELIEAGRALGVEFLTPDELVASLKGSSATA